MRYKIIDTHIDDIKVGDTIMIGGIMHTVCKNNIRTGGFYGTTIFGDSYNSGYKPVKKVIIYRAVPKHISETGWVVA